MVETAQALQEPASKSGAPRYKAFLSYSWKDKDAAAALHRALETFRMPKSLVGRETRYGPAPERLHPIFRDREEQAAGADLKAAIEDALDRSDCLIVVCSPNAATSPWVNKEIAYFRKRCDRARVFSYVIAGEPGASALPGRESEECFPPALRVETAIDGTPTAEPIGQPLAADARPDGDGVKAAQLKIVAAVLGVGLDELVRRDLERRAREQRRVALVFGSIAALMTGVAFYALDQRDRANDNAKMAQREAMTAQRTSEFMVSLFELADPGEQRGQKATAEEILKRGAETIERDLKDEPAVQGALMDAMGRSYTGLGLYADAARLLTVARDKRVETKAAPQDLYATELALARAQFEKGDLEPAKALFSKLAAAAEADIAKGGWRVEYARAMAGLGETILYADGPDTGPHTAVALFERARDQLRSRGLGDSDDLARIHQGLGGALVEANEFDEAEQSYLKAAAIYKVRPSGRDLKLANVENDLGEVYYLSRRLDDAAAAYEYALREKLRLLDAAHPEVIISENNLARILIESGEFAKAQQILRGTISKIREINSSTDFGLAYVYNNYGLALSESQKCAEADHYFRRASDASGPGHRLSGEIAFNSGRCDCAQGDVESGLPKLEASRKSLAAHFEQDDWRFAVADEFESRCLAAAGERTRARALAQSAYARLSTMLTDKHYFARRAKKWRDSLS
jgi:tetratricopeptide (TPR) repeat protein